MPNAAKSTRLGSIIWLIAGILLVVGAWSLPVNLKSVSPALLTAAGSDTPGIASFGRDLVDYEKLGAAVLIHRTAVAVGDPRAPALGDAIARFSERQPELVPWGGWDPFLDPIFKLRETTPGAGSTPVLTFFAPEEARRSLRTYLATSRSQGVLELLELRSLTATGRFAPAAQAGGQPLDAVILLTALLYQGDHLSAPLQRELRRLTEESMTAKELGDLEPFFLNLLSLAQRLDWIQLSELLRRTQDSETVGEYAHLARVAPEQVPLIYSAALFADSADKVASYLLEFGKAGLDDLNFAIARGQGALNLILSRQAPINHGPLPELGAGAEFGLLHPQLSLAAKWLALLLGVFGILRGIDRLAFSRDPTMGPTLPHLQGSVLALLLAGVLVLVTEPYLLKAAPPSEFRVRFTIPVLASVAEAPPASPATVRSNLMDTSTLLSIGVFAVLQIGMYLICLVKIREIAATPVPPAMKLKLMENEENLFDGGLYVGIAGTATALILQVLKVIEPNLLAAFASNLFGITCVALVKIRHVRLFKRQLILQGQTELHT